MEQWSTGAMLEWLARRSLGEGRVKIDPLAEN
jgi:hypothetical protein